MIPLPPDSMLPEPPEPASNLNPGQFTLKSLMLAIALVAVVLSVYQVFGFRGFVFSVLIGSQYGTVWCAQRGSFRLMGFCLGIGIVIIFIVLPAMDATRDP